jgi:hypothetical protein|tara:strand:+ start:2678 stop:3271 length:594 start_codon:yes stop_codon:yes gene_type:complete
MIVRFSCKDKKLKDSVTKAIKEIYRGKINKPIHISFRKGMKINTGWHALESVDRYKRTPIELTKKDIGSINETHSGLLHVIQLSKTDFEETQKGLKSDIIPYPWPEIFSEHRRLTDPQLCWLSLILSHELQHGWQTDLLTAQDGENFRYQHKCINMRKKKGLSLWAHKSLWEYDAELYAKDNSNKLFSMIKKGFTDG